MQRRKPRLRRITGATHFDHSQRHSRQRELGRQPSSRCLPLRMRRKATLHEPQPTADGTPSCPNQNGPRSDGTQKCRHRGHQHRYERVGATPKEAHRWRQDATPTSSAAQPEPLAELRAVDRDSTDLPLEVRPLQPTTAMAPGTPPNPQLLGQLNIDAPKPLLKLDIFKQTVHSDSPPAFANRRGPFRNSLGQVFRGAFLVFLAVLDQNEDRNRQITGSR